MKQLAALRQYLVESEFFNSEELETWTEDIDIKARGKLIGEKVLLHEIAYRAVFAIEKYAYKQQPIELLNATLITWLMENDDRSELEDPDPSISPSLLDDETASLEITVNFEEEVYIEPAENGPIFFKGKHWALSDGEVDVAETIALSIGIKHDDG